MRVLFLVFLAHPRKQQRAQLVDVEVGGPNATIITGCNRQISFTYFETNVFIPAGTIVSEFTVSIGVVDGGARAYVFNSANPNGEFVPGRASSMSRRGGPLRTPPGI